MLYDTHIHTAYSHDSRMPIEEAIARAGQLQLGIILTEHIDLNYPDPEAFRFDPAAYFRDYAKYRDEKVMLGVEIGMGIDELDDNKKLVEKYPFDYVLGSIHIVNGIDLYVEEFYHGKTKKQAYTEYLAAMADCAACYDFIDSLGHIDYICRYARFDDRELYYAEFCDAIDEVLTALARQGKCIELNTRRLDDKAAINHLIPVYRRFKELGGEFVTIGSDAHNPRDIGKHFDIATDITASLGLKPVWFKERQMQLITI